MPKHARLQLIAYALAQVPSSGFLWYLNLEVFAIFRSSRAALAELGNVPSPERCCSSARWSPRAGRAVAQAEAVPCGLGQPVLLLCGVPCLQLARLDECGARSGRVAGVRSRFRPAGTLWVLPSWRSRRVVFRRPPLSRFRRLAVQGMTGGDVASYFVLVVTAALLFYIAVTDLREFKIRNDVILVVAGLFFVHAFLSGRWVEMHWHIGLAALAFAFMVYWYAQGLMGGGDLKLMTVALYGRAYDVQSVPYYHRHRGLIHALVAKLGYVAAQP